MYSGYPITPSLLSLKPLLTSPLSSSFLSHVDFFLSYDLLRLIRGFCLIMSMEQPMVSLSMCTYLKIITFPLQESFNRQQFRKGWCKGLYEALHYPTGGKFSLVYAQSRQTQLLCYCGCKD